MKGNQGLDALAAAAGNSPVSGTTASASSSSSTARAANTTSARYQRSGNSGGGSNSGGNDRDGGATGPPPLGVGAPAIPGAAGGFPFANLAQSIIANLQQQQQPSSSSSDAATALASQLFLGAGLPASLTAPPPPSAATTGPATTSAASNLLAQLMLQQQQQKQQQAQALASQYGAQQQPTPSQLLLNQHHQQLLQMATAANAGAPSATTSVRHTVKQESLQAGAQASPSSLATASGTVNGGVVLAGSGMNNASSQQQQYQKQQQQQQQTMKPPPTNKGMSQHTRILPSGSSVADAVAVVNQTLQAQQQRAVARAAVGGVPAAGMGGVIGLVGGSDPATSTNGHSMYSSAVTTTSSGAASVDGTSGTSDDWSDKKSQKRAANRKSAQMSRKRKKQFIEELKDENDELRRKEQILRAIPDLIVVFDSSGRLNFVSESVGRFLDMSKSELIGSSFWDRLCEDSVRLLKAAFMDSLAARQDGSDTAPLGNGVWELRLVNKDNKYMIINLNGVVHFKGDAPECVCSIRPHEEDGTLRKLSKAPITGSVKASSSTTSPPLSPAVPTPTEASSAGGPGPVTSLGTVISSSSSSRTNKKAVIQRSSSSGSDNGSRFQSVVKNEELLSNSSSGSSSPNTDDDVDVEVDKADADAETTVNNIAEMASASRKRRQIEAAQAAGPEDVEMADEGGEANDGGSSGSNSGGRAVRISDGDSEEAVDVSESGSDDGVTSTSGSN